MGMPAPAAPSEVAHIANNSGGVAGELLSASGVVGVRGEDGDATTPATGDKLLGVRTSEESEGVQISEEKLSSSESCNSLPRLTAGDVRVCRSVL